MGMKSLGQILTERDLITSKDLRDAQALSVQLEGQLPAALLRLGALSEEALLSAMSEQLDMSILSGDTLPENSEPYQSAVKQLGVSQAWCIKKRCALWMDNKDETVLHMATSNPFDMELLEALDKKLFDSGLTLREHLCSHQTMERALSFIQTEQSLDDRGDARDADTDRLREMAEEAPVIDFVNRIFSMALKDNASDIHVEPFEHKFQVRYRIDGVLHERQTEPKSNFDAVASRIKLLSGMDIAERRLPQDGRQTIRFSGQEIDLRVSSLPGSWGESLVLRLLRKETSLLDLESLGLDGHAKIVLQNLLSNPNGVILVTGPTGSGKSTTLYQSLQGLNDGISKIITIEDPVEYDMAGIIQIQTNSNIDYTFARGLKAILRQDPDIIMVGEIRDSETATIAAQAALTGHLVLSTLHTNSALAAVARLVDMGLEPYMVSSAVRGLVAQRLVRRLCPHCAVKVENKEGEDMIWARIADGCMIDLSNQKKPNWHESKGCPECMNTGYSGRVALFEAVKIDDALATDILQGVSLQNLVKTARKQGFVTLFEEGLLKARRGLTTLSEVMRVCGESSQLPKDG